VTIIMDKSLAKLFNNSSIKLVEAGILLALGYAAGATAPIMVTAAAIIADSSGALLEPVMALPYHLYILFNEHISMNQAYATALVLVILLLLLNTLVLWLHSLQERINNR
jgi:phosphate transport system permease protein